MQRSLRVLAATFACAVVPAAPATAGIWTQIPSGTTHGTQNEYDRRVPLALLGHGIRPGRYHREVSPADIAPTLALLCGVTLAHADGRALVEALEGPLAQRR